MSSNFYTETHTYREGRILLYKRPNSQNFQCRLRVEGIKGYTIKSCDTPNQGRALKFAEDLYDNLRFKKLNNLPLETRTFRQIFDEWFKKADKSEYRQDFYQGRAKLYLFPYFGDYKIEEITENIIDDYWSWRKNYYKDNPEKVKGRTAEKPSNQSLKMEKTAILEILEYAHRRGYIRAVPKINFNPRTKTESRDTFSQDEMVKLLNSFKKWSSQAKKSSDIYQRKMIYYLIVFLINSGIRPNEFYKIRWKDIIVHTQDGLKTLYVSISDNTKTGKRVDESAKYIQDCYELLYDLEIVASKYQYSVQFLGKSKDYYSIMLCQNRRASNDLLHNLNQKMTQISECFSDSRIRPLLRQGRRILNERVERLMKKYKI